MSEDLAKIPNDQLPSLAEIDYAYQQGMSDYILGGKWLGRDCPVLLKAYWLGRAWEDFRYSHHKE